MTPADKTTPDSFTPALGQPWLTLAYDLAIAALTRESAFAQVARAANPRDAGRSRRPLVSAYHGLFIVEMTVANTEAFIGGGHPQNLVGGGT